MTSQRRDLLEALSQIQNHPAHRDHDILTITGCGMTDDEVRAHIERSMADVFAYSNNPPKAKRTRRTA